MKRMLRWLLNGLTALSILLCVAITVFSIRSYRIYDFYRHIGVNTTQEWGLDHGRFFLITEHFFQPDRKRRWFHHSAWGAPGPPEYRYWSDFYVHDDVQPLIEFAGFIIAARHPEDPIRVERLIVVPLWAICIPFACLPLRWLITRRQCQRLRQPGRCSKCGYDLRATPDRCPECGTLAVPLDTVRKRTG